MFLFANLSSPAFVLVLVLHYTDDANATVPADISAWPQYSFSVPLFNRSTLLSASQTMLHPQICCSTMFVLKSWPPKHLTGDAFASYS